MPRPPSARTCAAGSAWPSRRASGTRTSSSSTPRASWPRSRRTFERSPKPLAHRDGPRLEDEYFALFDDLHRRGVNVALGLDDRTINDDEDAVMELRMLHKLHRVPDYDLRTPALSAADVLRMGTVNGARAVGFAGQIGALRPGMKADMILVDLDRILRDPWLAADLPITEAFLHRAMGQDVDTAIVGCCRASSLTIRPGTTPGSRRRKPRPSTC